MIKGIFKNNKIKEVIKDYEFRPQQPEMAEFVFNCLKNNEHGIIEAPTGVGKSLAYLIAAIEYIDSEIDDDKKIIISTNTVNLQKQLLTYDIPAAKKIVDKDIKIVSFKGRNHYLCLRKVEQAEFSGLQLTKKESDKLLKQFSIIKAYNITDRQNSDFQIDTKLWLQLCSDHYTCFGNKCAHFMDCPFYKAKRKAQSSDILIINHSLFFADLKIRILSGERDTMLALPPYTSVIFDEAHNLESSATKFLTQSLSIYVFKRLKSDIFRDIIKPEKLESSKKAELLSKQFDDILTIAGDLFLKFNDQLLQYKRIELNRISIPTTHFNELCKNIGAVSDLITKFFVDEEDEELNALLKLYKQRIASIYDRLTLFRDQDDPTYVYWCESKNNSVFLYAAPIHIGQMLENDVFSIIDSVILTSATLSVNNNFDYFRSRIGIRTKNEKMLDSPYSADNTLIYVDKDLPEPNTFSFIEKASCVVQDILQYSNGNAFVLFTSYRALENMFDELEIPLTNNNMTVIKQSGTQRHLILEEFKDSNSPVLFATSSFWEGVDVKGEKLKCIIITKLPFDVPDDPIINSRKQHMKNAFMEYLLPEAILRLKQGMGRLIRSSSDRGIIALLDSRIIHKKYGHQIMQNFTQFKKTNSIKDIGKFF